ncbi:G-protein coupled receptor 55a [Megalops cyprinoides]|uniref:G-protein coupled receptor 55a n=1 Tax=Megalops cyprinoides TaxID=118141 RepID=UPI001864B1C7|nr:G-protein coupled receptor 55a [Megalops cyprinoides]
MDLCDAVCWVQRIIYIPTTAVGLPLNLAALWMLFFRIRRYTESTVFLTNLVLSDILLIFSLPFKIYAYNRRWGLGRNFCSFLESLVYVNMYGSILFIVCISVDRYIALRFPFKGKKLRSPRKSTVICLAIWILIFATNHTVYTLHDHGEWCFQNFSNTTWNKVGIVVSMEITFSVSTTIIIFCSINVLLILRGLRKQNPHDEKLRNNQSVKIVISNLIVFLVCFIPYHIAALIYFWAKNSMVEPKDISPLRQFVHISACVSSVNCLFDGIGYYFILKENWLAAKQERKQLSVRQQIHESIRGTKREKQELNMGKTAAGK